MLIKKSFRRPAFAGKSILIGDSITWNYYTDPLGIFTGTWQIDAFGIPGGTIADLESNLPDLTNYDHIFILLGVNDLMGGSTAAQVKIAMLSLLNTVRYRDTYIISILPLDNAQQPFPLNSQVIAANALLKGMGNFINCYDALAVGPGGSNPYTLDGIHPNQAGYDIIEPILYANILDL